MGFILGIGFGFGFGMILEEIFLICLGLVLFYLGFGV
jgi:hypothetical protein